MTSTSTAAIYILHIEHDPMIVSAMKRVLHRKFNAVVIPAATAEQAKELLPKFEWSVIISDWLLEGSETGGDIYKHVVDNFPNLLDKYIFNSSHGPSELLSNATNTPFLEKPSSVSQIIEAVEKILKRQPQSTERT